MRRYLVLILFLCSLNATQAQTSNWELTSTPLEIQWLRALYSDTVSDNLYVCGMILDSTLTWQRQSVLRYDGLQWDSLSGLDAQTFDLTIYNGELYACGSYGMVSGVPNPYLVKHNGTGWEPFGEFNNAVFGLEVLNGELYALGVFDSVDGIHARGVAKWTGTSWSSLGFDREGTARVAEIYNGELYVGGTTTHNGFLEDLSVLSGGVWQTVGVGFFGNFNSINDLQIYQGELYACGLIQGSAGNVGSMIQKWDGVQWTNVGTGLQGPFNDSSSTSQAFDMAIHDGKLYVCGNFDYADHVPAEGIASWDGVQWCGYNTTGFMSSAVALASFKDTLFMASAEQTGIAFEKNLIKWVGGSFVDVCGPMVGLSELESKDEHSLYPNPIQDFGTLETLSDPNCTHTILLFDAFGRLVKEEEFIGNRYTVQRGNVPAGAYFYSVRNADWIQIAKGSLVFSD